MAGVDWLQNATWLLQVHRKPGQALRVIPKPYFGLHVYWQTSTSVSVRQDGVPKGEHLLHGVTAPKQLDPGHGLILRYNLPQPRHPGLYLALFGSKDARPWRASVRGFRNREPGDVSAARRCRWSTQLILSPDGGLHGAAIGAPSTRSGTTSLRLWSVSPCPAYAKGALIVLSDPDCSRELRCACQIDHSEFTLVIKNLG